MQLQFKNIANFRHEINCPLQIDPPQFTFGNFKNLFLTLSPSRWKLLLKWFVRYNHYIVCEKILSAALHSMPQYSYWKSIICLFFCTEFPRASTVIGLMSLFCILHTSLWDSRPGGGSSSGSRQTDSLLSLERVPSMQQRTVFYPAWLHEQTIKLSVEIICWVRICRLVIHPSRATTRQAGCTLIFQHFMGT